MRNTVPAPAGVLHIAPGAARRPSDLTRLGRAAVWYASHGWEVAPLYPVRSGLCTCPQSTHCKAPGMHPIPQGGKTGATTQVPVVVAWWSQCPDAGIALRPGPASGFLVLRIDRQRGGDDALARLPDLPRTVRAHDGIGQRFLFFAYPVDGGVRPGATDLGAGIELSAEGVAIIAPPTLCAGGLHRWEPEFEPWRMPLAPVPQWLANASLAKAPLGAGPN